LKQLNLKDHSSLVVQVMLEEEILDQNEFVLFFARRDISTRTYIDMQEVRFNGSRIRDLKKTARKLFGLDDEE
jgi:hypothetical protein